MKLLQKSEIDAAKVADKKREIDEGTKLAKRIDSLREIAAQEETALAKFRSETLKNLNDEIVPKVAERDSLDGQIKTRKDELIELQKPLDSKWEEIKNREKEIDLRESSVSGRELSAKEQEKKLILAREDVEKTITRAALDKAISEAHIHTAKAATDRANRALEGATKAAKDVLEITRLEEIKLTHREEMVSAREGDVTIKETDLSTREKALADGWILLLDRQAMLEQELKRAKQ